jgi:alpha-methylacyl-CoA racemase
VARNTFVPVEGSVPQLAPAPRLSRTPGEVRPTYAYPGVDTESVLAEFGFDADEIAGLHDSGVIAW